MKNFEKIDVKALQGNVFSLFDEGWGLVTAGEPTNFNTMTISWGGLGWIWNTPVAFTFVRPSRYTYEFLEQRDTFTISLFEKGEHRAPLGVLGSKSGRDMDKMKASGLTPIEIEGEKAFAEAKIILVCKKLYSTQFEYDKLPQDIASKIYGQEHAKDTHVAYTSEIRGCYVKK